MLILFTKQAVSNRVLYPTVLSAQDDSIFSKLLASPPKTKVDKRRESFDLLKSDVSNLKGTFSIYVKDLRTSVVYENDSTKQIFAASLYKIPTAIAVLKQIDLKKLNMTDTVVYTSADYEGGTGSLNQSSYGTYFTVEQLVNAQLKNSDNVAQNMLVRKIGHTEVLKTVETLNKDQYLNPFVFNNVYYAKGIGLIFENLLKGDYLSPVSKKLLFDLMTETSFDDRIAPYVGEDNKFSHKIGNWGITASWHDCGVVFNSKYQATHIVCLMTEGVNYDDFLSVSKLLGEFVSAN